MFIALQDVVCVLEPDSCTVLLVNPAIERLFGYDEGDVFGQPISLLYDDDALYERFEEDMLHALNAHEVFQAETRMRGKDGKLFTLWKFRSMEIDSEADGAPRWADEGDPRVTRVGRLIRKLRIDELPQLWNVLRGEMSLVGPRPEREPFVRRLMEMSPFYGQRHVVRPGLTGWAQIRTSYAASYEDSLEKLKYDLYYVKNLSFWLDASIMISTIRIVLFGRGGR